MLEKRGVCKWEFTEPLVRYNVRAALKADNVVRMMGQFSNPTHDRQFEM